MGGAESFIDRPEFDSHTATITIINAAEESVPSISAELAIISPYRFSRNNTAVSQNHESIADTENYHLIDDKATFPYNQVDHTYIL